MEKTPIEIKVSWGETGLCLGIGSSLIILLITGIIWLVYPFFTIQNRVDIFSISLLTIVAVIVGLPFLIYLVGMFSFMLLSVGVSNSIKLKKFDGLIYRLDHNGLTYFEKNERKFKTWSEISDVGCFKQQNEKVKILYKYQIKFEDGTIHEFDLRGKYPTKEFKNTIEDYWMFYNG